MTSTDHTARACSSVRNEPKSQHYPYSDLQLYPLSPEQERRLPPEIRIAGVALAAATIGGLLEYNDACKRANLRIKRNAIIPWPLTPAQVSGMYAALYHLREYVGLLQSEPGS
jgi:hypothetical protein